MSEFTLVRPPGSLWECDDCGALVIRCSVHTAWHEEQERHRHHFQGADGMPRVTHRSQFIPDYDSEGAY